MRKLANFIYRAAVIFLVLFILGSLLSLAALIVLDIPGASYRIGSADPDLNPVERTLLSTYLALQENRLQEPAGDLSAIYDLEVTEGDSASVVIAALAENRILAKPFLFRMYMRYLGFDRGIEPGIYQLSGNMNMTDIALDLQNANPGEIRFTVIPGWRIEQVAEALSSSFPAMQVPDLLSAFNMPPIGTSYEADVPPGASLEGYLLPDTYVFQPDAVPTDLVFAMLDNFDRQVTSTIQEDILLQGLTLHEAVILASIIEREAVLPEEMPLIASVYLNRIDIGMRLEADPTVQYPLGIVGRWWKSPLTYADLDFDSPYNTYLYPGLPPGPISNPSLSALIAVGQPAQSTYLFFRATCDGSGSHLFADTYEQHLQNACP